MRWSLGIFGAVAAAVLVAGTALAAEPKVINPKSAFPEGPFVQDGILYYVEYGANRAMAWDGETNREVWKQDGCGPAAIAPYLLGYLVTCYDSGTLVAITGEGATLGTYEKDAEGKPLVGPNDLAPDGEGGLWVTASGPWESDPIVGKLYHLSHEGILKPLADDLHYANGVALSADGQRLYVIESEGHRIISFAIGDDGSLSDRRRFAEIGALDEKSGSGAYPDGMKVGPDGNLYVGQFSSGRIVVLTPDGKFVKAITVPSATAPNLAFSADGKTMYVMAVDELNEAPYWGKVYAVELE